MHTLFHKANQPEENPNLALNYLNPEFTEEPAFPGLKMKKTNVRMGKLIFGSFAAVVQFSAVFETKWDI